MGTGNPAVAFSLLNVQEFRRVSPEYRCTLAVVEARSSQNVIHPGGCPRIGMIRSEHNLSRAANGYEMAQRLTRKHERVDIELLQIIRGTLVELLRALLGEREATMIRPVRIRRKIAAPMSRANLQPRETVQRSFEDQMRQRNGGSQRVSDDIGQNSIPRQPRLQLRNALRMHEDGHAQPFGFRPERIEPRRGQFLAGYVRPD